MIFFTDISNAIIIVSPSHFSIQLVEKILYDDNSPKRYRNILRHELELNWIKFLQIGFNGYFYHKGTIFIFTLF